MIEIFRLKASFSRLPSERSRGPPPYSSGRFTDHPLSANENPKSGIEVQTGRRNPIGLSTQQKFTSQE